MLSKKSDILNKLFFKELQQLIKKYNEIDSSKQEVIERVINHIDDELSEYIINNPNKLDEIVTAIITRKVDIDTISFFAWYNLQIKDISIENAISDYKTLQSDGYLEIEDYLIYRRNKYLKQYAKEALEVMLEDEYTIDRLFDKEMIIEFWINKTDKCDVISEMLQNDDLEEVLDINPRYAFKVSSGEEYKYAVVEY